MQLTYVYIACATAHNKQLTMNEILTQQQKTKIRQACFDNPLKMCAIAQVIIDTCQIVSTSTYAELKSKHRNSVLHQKEKLIGIEIENRKFISYIQQKK